jgi:hypothetical protein
LDAPATAANPIVAATEMPLDTQVDGLAPGHYMIVQVRLGGAEQVFVATDRLARVAAPPAVELAGAALETTETHFAAAWRPPHAGSIVHRTPARYTLVRKIADVENRSYTWGMVSGASTVVTLDLSLATDGNDEADIRTFTFHEVTAEPFALRAEPRPSALDRGSDLYYYGTDAQAQALRGRAVLLCRAGEDPEAVTVTDVEPGSAGALETFRRVALDRSVSYADFPHEEPTTLVYGNLVAATQGKTESQVVLGSGDQRKAFQTFAVPKAPLTYLLDETQSPAHVPELTVLVDGVEWTPVDSFFNYGSDDAVYVVREDAEHKSYIQFGDGKNGRRLPSGRGNVTLIYRVGSGATGLPKPGAKPSIAGKLKDFVKLDLPGAVTVGAGPETADGARLAAPGKIQSLGRMVSLADIEAEALALPHVRKALATWSAPDGVPLVRLVVLTESETVADLAAVRDSVQTFNRCRGPARYAIDVVHGALQFVYLRIVAGYDAARREADVAATIRRALGVVGGGEEGAGGLFALESRRFGENAHTSQVIGAVQNAAGVAWVRLDGAAILSLGSPPQADPLALALPTVDVVQPVLACQSDRVLALHSTHLILVLSQDVTRDGCSV